MNRCLKLTSIINIELRVHTGSKYPARTEKSSKAKSLECENPGLSHSCCYEPEKAGE